MANQMMMVALGWQMYELTNSAWRPERLVGLFQFTLPVLLLLTLPAGHVADRFPARRIVACMPVTAGRGSAAAGRETWGHFLSRELLLGISVLLGAARTFQAPAQTSLVSSLVVPGMLARAMALSSAGNQVAVIGGPAAAGILFIGTGSTVYGAATALLVMAVIAMLQVQDQRVLSLARERPHAAVHVPASTSSGRASHCWARSPST